MGTEAKHLTHGLVEFFYLMGWFALGLMGAKRKASARLAFSLPYCARGAMVCLSSEPFFLPRSLSLLV